MCAIAGMVRLRDTAPPIDPTRLRAVSDHMAARGPDDSGLWLDAAGEVGLANRRLAIIDLSAGGHQPMEDPETGNQIVFNGEIYNYRALADNLRATGCRLRTQSDTEVILHLFRREGISMLGRLHGMFAIALWDARARVLVLARDPYGIKPLYVAEHEGTFVFASQVRALRQLPEFRARAPSLPAEIAFFLLGYVPEPLTFFEGISALPAGCYLTVNRSKPAKPVAFASIAKTLEDAAAAPMKVKNRAALIHESVTESLRRHMVADVPVGLFLSAGRDSSVLAALATKESHERLRTTTLAFGEFEGSEADEAPIAQSTAAALETEHHTAYVGRADFDRQFAHLLDAMDQPSIDGVNTYFVSKVTAERGIKVALSGLGSDELFGGYGHFRTIPRLVGLFGWSRSAMIVGRALRRAVSPFASVLASPKYAGLMEYGTSIEDAYLLSRSLFAPWELSKIFGSEKAADGLAALIEATGLPSASRPVGTSHARIAAIESEWYMRNQLLRDTDWASMAHSLEVRVPFVDYQLLEALAPLIAGPSPPTKEELFEPFRSELPAALAARPKTGFSVPINSWLAEAGDNVMPGARWRRRGLRPWALLLHDHFTRTV